MLLFYKKVGLILKNFLIITLFLSFYSVSAQKPFVVRENTPLSYIGYNLFIFEDTQANLTINQILEPKHQEQFTQCMQESPNLHLTYSAIWSKFHIENQTNETVYLQIHSTFLDDIQLYGIDSTNTVKLIRHTGDTKTFESRHFLVSQFILELPTQYRTFYLRVETTGAMQLPLRVGTIKALIAYTHKWDLGQGLFFGLCFIILLYNLLIYVKLREKLNLLYALYVFAIALGTGQINGLYFEWIWGDYPTLNQYDNVLYATGMISVFFSTYFLKSWIYAPRLHKIAYYSLIFYVILVILGLAGYERQANLISQFIIPANVLFSLVMSLVVMQSGYRPARYFFLAWFFVFIGIFIFVLSLVGLLPVNTITINGVQIGSAIEMLILSYAIAKKIEEINIAKQEAEAANVIALAKNEQLIKEQYILLERKIQERTFELQQTKEEVMLQNEELKQKQDEIIAQKDLITIQNKNLSRQNEKINDGIKASLAIQRGILPDKEDIKKWLNQSFVFYQPKDIVSGDLYWFAAWEEDKTVTKILAIMDCTGHGVQGALTSMIARTLFDEVVLIDLQDNPAEILEKVHQKVDTIFHKDIYNDNEIETGMDVALCVCTYKPEEKNVEVTFCGAKRPLFYVLPDTQDLRIIQGIRKSIGGKQQKKFENQQITLPINTMLYLCSDGYADQNNMARESFGLLRFQQLLGEISIMPIEEQYQILENELTNFMQDTEQRDDIVVWGVRL